MLSKILLSIHKSVARVTNLTTKTTGRGVCFTFVKDKTEYRVIVTSVSVQTSFSYSKVMKIQLKTEPQMTDIEIGGNDIAFCWSDERTGLTVVELSDAGADHLVRRNVSFLNLSPEMATLGSTLSHVDYRLDDNQICFAATKVETLRRQTPRRVRAPRLLRRNVREPFAQLQRRGG